MEVAQNIELLLTQDSGGGGPGERVLQKYHLTFHRSVDYLKKKLDQQRLRSLPDIQGAFLMVPPPK